MADVLTELRKALVDVNLEREKSAEPRFFLASEAEVEIKFFVETSKEKKGKVGFDLWVVSPTLNANQKLRQENSHTLRLKLAPILSQSKGGEKNTATIIMGGQVKEVTLGPHTPTLGSDPSPVGKTSERISFGKTGSSNPR